ncbi:hypothetical protein JQK86_19710 [Clostridium beijerinckii]|nr:hypothetical protein [Clostridium sp. 2-1]MBN7585998.1 hypothetical protein [Clostridium beijerinckii]
MKGFDTMKYNYNFDNVKWGKECKYCDLCDMLQIPRKTGNSKSAQIKDMRTVMELDNREKGIFIPRRLYDIEKTQLSSGLLREEIEVLTLDLLARNEGRHISLTIKRLMRALEMINDNYIKGYSYEKIYLDLEELTKVDIETIGDVYGVINTKGARNIKEALKDLQDKALIIWEFKMMVCVKECIYKHSVSGKLMYDENDNPMVEREEMVSRFPTDREKEIVLDIERKAMKEMSVKKKSFFNFCKEAGSKFKARCKQLLKDTDIEYYYYVYDITYNSEEVLEELKRSELAEVRNRLNLKMINQTIKTIEERKENNELQLQETFGDAYDILDAYEDKLTKEQRIVHKDDYEKDAKKTARLLISRGIRSRDKLK